MSNIGILPTPQTLAPSYAPLGKPTAGLESAENKDQTLPPVEEAGASEKNRNQSQRKIEEAVAQDERNARHRHTSDDDIEPPPVEEAIALIETVLSTANEKSELPLVTELQRVATLHGEHAPHGLGPSAALDRFNEAAGHTLVPGILLDQRS